MLLRFQLNDFVAPLVAQINRGVIGYRGADLHHDHVARLYLTRWHFIEPFTLPVIVVAVFLRINPPLVIDRVAAICYLPAGRRVSARQSGPSALSSAPRQYQWPQQPERDHDQR